MIWRSEKFEATVHGSDISVIHKLAGQPSYWRCLDMEVSVGPTCSEGRFLPAAVDVIQLLLVSEIGTVDGELVIGVQLRLVRPGCFPRILTNSLNDEHAVVDSRAVVLAPHLHFRRRRVAIGVRSEDDIPIAVDVVDLGGPDVGGVAVARAFLWLEDELGLDIVPIC